MKLRAEHCGVSFSVERLTERMVDAERFVKCVVCGASVPHTWSSDLDRLEHLQSMLPGEPDIELLKLLIAEYFKTNRADSFIEYFNRMLEE